MHSIHKGPHMFWVHVRVKSMAQVGNVALWPKVIQHLLHQPSDLLLEDQQGIGYRRASKPSYSLYIIVTHTTCTHASTMLFLQSLIQKSLLDA